MRYTSTPLVQEALMNGGWSKFCLETITSMPGHIFRNSRSPNSSWKAEDRLDATSEWTLIVRGRLRQRDREVGAVLSDV